MSEYPERRLGDVIRLDIDEVSVSPNFTYEIAGVYSFGRGLFSRGPIQGTQTSYTKLNRLRNSSIVLSRLKAFEGAISLVNKEFDGSFLSSEFPTFSASVDTDGRYIGFLCQWPEFWKSLSKGSKGLGARRERVSVERLLEIKAPLPDLVEQQRVADKLDALLGRVDAVQELRASFSNLQGSLNESLVSRISEEAVETVQVGDVLALARTPITIDPEAPYHVIGVKSFGKGIIHYPSTLGSDVSKLSYFKLPADALLLSNIKAWEGAIGVTTETVARDYVASNRFLSYMPCDERVNSSYLRHYFLSHRGLAQVSAASPGGADRNRTLGRKRFEALEIPLPLRAEQDRVARILDSFAECVSKVHAGPALDALRPSILNAAFTGQL
ncbi:MAG: restriction endonuclease subunit S [Pseudonocardiaceae bacterium]